MTVTAIETEAGQLVGNPHEHEAVVMMGIEVFNATGNPISGVRLS